MKKLCLAFIMALLLCANAYGTEQWREDGSEETVESNENPSDLDTIIYENIVSPLDRVLANHIQGCELSYVGTTEISVAAGEVVASNSGGTARLMLSNSSATSVTKANLDTGSSFTSSTTHYVYAGTSTTSDTTFTVYVSTSSSAPTGVTYYIQLGQFYVDSDGDIVESSVYANNPVNMDDDGRLPYANSIAKILHATDSTTSSSYANMDGGGQWQSFEITLSSTSTILVIGGCEISSNSSTVDGYIQVVYGSTQIAEAHAGGDGATYPDYENVGIYGIATNVSAGTYTIRPQLKAGSASVNTLGKIYCMVYIIPE